METTSDELDMESYGGSSGGKWACQTQPIKDINSSIS